MILRVRGSSYSKESYQEWTKKWSWDLIDIKDGCLIDFWSTLELFWWLKSIKNQSWCSKMRLRQSEPPTMSRASPFLQPKRAQRPPRWLRKWTLNQIKIYFKSHQTFNTDFYTFEWRFLLISEATLRHFFDNNRRWSYDRLENADYAKTLKNQLCFNDFEGSRVSLFKGKFTKIDLKTKFNFDIHQT